MKITRVVAIVTFLAVQSTLAGVVDEVKTLQQLAMGGDEVQLSRSTDATDLLKKFKIKDNGEFEPEFFVNKEIDEMSFGDEVNFGFTSAKSALGMKEFAQSQMEEELENVYDDEARARELKVQIYDLNKGWDLPIKRLERLGVKFGYDGHGPGYCGVSFIRLLILDPKTNKVHIVYLSESGPC